MRVLAFGGHLNKVSSGGECHRVAKPGHRGWKTGMARLPAFLTFGYAGNSWWTLQSNNIWRAVPCPSLLWQSHFHWCYALLQISRLSSEVPDTAPELPDGPAPLSIVDHEEATLMSIDIHLYNPYGCTQECYARDCFGYVPFCKCRLSKHISTLVLLPHSKEMLTTSCRSNKSQGSFDLWLENLMGIQSLKLAKLIMCQFCLRKQGN